MFSPNLFLTFCLKMITDSQEVAQIEQRSHVPFASPRKVAVVWDHNKKIAIGLIHSTYQDFTSWYTFIYVCACVVLCNWSYIDLSNHHHNQNNRSTTTWRLPCSPFIATLHPSLVTTNLFYIAIILSFWEYYINGIMQSVTFGSWLFSLIIIPFRTISSSVCQ